MKICVHSLVDKLKWFYENARCYNKTYRTLHVSDRFSVHLQEYSTVYIAIVICHVLMMDRKPVRNM